MKKMLLSSFHQRSTETSQSDLCSLQVAELAFSPRQSEALTALPAPLQEGVGKSRGWHA